MRIIFILTLFMSNNLAYSFTVSTPAVIVFDKIHDVSTFVLGSPGSFSHNVQVKGSGSGMDQFGEEFSSKKYMKFSFSELFDNEKNDEMRTQNNNCTRFAMMQMANNEKYKFTVTSYNGFMVIHENSTTKKAPKSGMEVYVKDQLSNQGALVGQQVAFSCALSLK